MGSSPNWPFGKVPTPQEWVNSQTIKLDDFPVLYASPGTGTTLESDINQGGWQLSPPSGGIATLSVIAPPCELEGQRFTISTIEEITALTVVAASGQNLLRSSVGILPQFGVISWRFRLADLTWYPWSG